MRPSAHVASSYGIKRESNTAGWHWPQKSRRAGISFAVLFNLICAIQHCGSWTQPKISYRSVDVRNRIVSSTRIGLKRPQLEYLQATTTLVLRGGEDTQRGDAADGATALTGELAEEVLKALECSTCMELMFEPVTLACGHSFCQNCLLAWMRTGQRICALCRFPVPLAQQPRPSLNLAQLCARLFPAEYAKRAQEVADQALVPPRGRESLHVLYRGEIIYPGSQTRWLLPAGCRTAEMLRAAHAAGEHVLYTVGDEQGDSSALEVRVGSVAIEMEVASLQLLNSSAVDSLLPPGVGDQLLISLHAQARVALTQVSRELRASGSDALPKGMIRARGRRMFDSPHITNYSALEQSMVAVRRVLPMVLANIVLDDELPSQPEDFSLFVAYAISTVTNTSMAVHRHLLAMTSTEQRLEAVRELIDRLRCPRLERGSLLVSTREEPDFSFGGSVVLLTEHGPTGSVGFIVNQEIGALAPLLYPNGTAQAAAAVAAAAARMPAGHRALRLMYGGPVELGRGRGRTRVLAGSHPEGASEPFGGSRGSHVGHLELVPGVFLFPPVAPTRGDSGEDDEPGASSASLGSSIEVYDGEESSGAMVGSQGGMVSDRSSLDGSEMQLGGDEALEPFEHNGSVFSSPHSEMREPRTDNVGEGTEAAQAVQAARVAQGAAPAADERMRDHEVVAQATRVAQSQHTMAALAAAFPPTAEASAAETQAETRRGGPVELPAQDAWPNTPGAPNPPGDERARGETGLLLHGYAAWMPLQLEREVRAGQWFVAPPGDRHTILRMPRGEMYARVRGNGALMPLDSEAFLEWCLERGRSGSLSTTLHSLASPLP